MTSCIFQVFTVNLTSKFRKLAFIVGKITIIANDLGSTIQGFLELFFWNMILQDRRFKTLRFMSLRSLLHTAGGAAFFDS